MLQRKKLITYQLTAFEAISVWFMAILCEQHTILIVDSEGWPTHKYSYSVGIADICAKAYNNSRYLLIFNSKNEFYDVISACSLFV